jgi:hypothetical protein
VGLRRKTFWIAVVVLIVIIGSISGGIGGYLSHKRSTPIQSNTPNDEPNIFPNISAKLSLESAFLNTSLAVSTRGEFNSTESYLFYQSNSLEFFFVLIQPEMSSIPQSLGSSYPARKYTPLSALGPLTNMVYIRMLGYTMSIPMVTFLRPFTPPETLWSLPTIQSTQINQTS